MFDLYLQHFQTSKKEPELFTKYQMFCMLVLS